jgi:hypothetical protein
MFRMAIAFSMVVTSTIGIASASAQDQPEGASLLQTGILGMGAGAGAAMKGQMLNSPAILRELKVTEAQIARLKRAEAEADLISRRIGEERRRLRRRYTAEGNEEGLAGLEHGEWKFVLSLSRADEQPLLKVLDGRQLARLQQLQLQADGPWALMRPEVQDRLRMSPEQVELAKGIFRQGREAIAKSATLPGDSKRPYPGMPAGKRAELLKSKEFGNQVDDVRKQIVKARNATMREIGEILNKNQRVTFEKMLGDPFEFPKLSDRRPFDAIDASDKAELVIDESKSPATGPKP